MLPNSISELVEVLGRERALFLVGRLPRFKRSDMRGGEQVILYVPRRLKPDHLLVRLLGWHDANRLVQAFGGELLKPGNCAEVYRSFRDDGLKSLVGGGVPVSMAADWFGMSERRIRQIVENAQV
jgi:hypothetical protein